MNESYEGMEIASKIKPRFNNWHLRKPKDVWELYNAKTGAVMDRFKSYEEALVAWTNKTRAKE